MALISQILTWYGPSRTTIALPPRATTAPCDRSRPPRRHRAPPLRVTSAHDHRAGSAHHAPCDRLRPPRRHRAGLLRPRRSRPPRRHRARPLRPRRSRPPRRHRNGKANDLADGFRCAWRCRGSQILRGGRVQSVATITIHGRGQHGIHCKVERHGACTEVGHAHVRR